MTELRQAFEETLYIVYHQPVFTLRIDQHSPELDALLQSTGHDCAAFITAWNPMSDTLAEEENRCRQEQLVSALEGDGYSCIPGIGQHPDNGWPGEESVLVLGLQVNQAFQIAVACRQLAFVWAGKGRACQLVLT